MPEPMTRDDDEKAAYAVVREFSETRDITDRRSAFERGVFSSVSETKINLRAMADEILRLRAECERKDADLKHYRNELLEARDEERRARRAMHLNGLVRCDSPACNCGSYHPTTPGAPTDGE